jgi:HD-GYP domain-containing protein (c-di-GMP phosphodiesterase class II)
MVKKIKTNQLRPGMYIHDINCSWLEHPFFGRSMQIDDDEMVEKIVKYGIRDVYIDTDIGLDLDSAPTKEEADRELSEEICKIDEINFDDIEHVSVGKEIFMAKKIRKEAMNTVQHVMNDIKMGAQINKEAVEDVVNDIIISMLRNPSALMSMGMLRNTDEYLYQHSISVCALMVSFGKLLGFDSKLLKEVGLGAMLHDIGTMRVPNKIICKQNGLTEEEYEQVKKHVIYGQDVLKETEGVTDMSIITAYQHHERMDGTGYPNGLKGDEISRPGKAIAIIDVYDALTTKRCYRHLIPPAEAIKMIYEWSETKFERELVQKFIKCIGIYPVGSLIRLESGLLGVVFDHSTEDLLRPLVRIVYDTKNERIVMPYVIDLSKPSGKGGADRIVGYESPEKWNVQPDAYL